MINVNSDVAIFKFSNRYSFSNLERDYRGELIAARSSCYQANIVVECAELMGIRKVLSWMEKQPP